MEGEDCHEGEVPDEDRSVCDMSQVTLPFSASNMPQRNELWSAMCGFYDRPCRTKRGWTQEGVPHAKMLQWQEEMQNLGWSKFNMDKKTQKAMPSV